MNDYVTVTGLVDTQGLDRYGCGTGTRRSFMPENPPLPPTLKVVKADTQTVATPFGDFFWGGGGRRGHAQQPKTGPRKEGMRLFEWQSWCVVVVVYLSRNNTATDRSM